MRALGGHWSALRMSGVTIGTLVPQDIRCKSYIRRRAEIVSAKTPEICIIRSKRLLNRIKNKHLSQRQKTLTRIKSLKEEMASGNLQILFCVPIVMHTKFPATVIVRSSKQQRSCDASLLVFSVVEIMLLDTLRYQKLLRSSGLVKYAMEGKIHVRLSKTQHLLKKFQQSENGCQTTFMIM